MLDIRQRTGYLFLSVMLFHLILISAQVQSKSGVPVLESVTFGLFSRVQGATASVIGGVRGAWRNYVDLRGVRAENEVLHQQVSELEVRLQEQRALAARTERLQQLLDLRGSTKLATIPADVIAGNPVPGMLTVTINRGSADGIQPDMAVIAPRGIVGRVVGPLTANAARVQLIIDRYAAVGAITERTRSGGLVLAAVGEDPPLKMDLVGNLADVKSGDVVVASGVDGIYPKGFVIGTVEKSERGKELHRDITVRPAVDFSSLEEVLVVLVPARGAADEPAGTDRTKEP
jgi:rod shape-determining protein MreC